MKYISLKKMCNHWQYEILYLDKQFLTSFISKGFVVIVKNKEWFIKLMMCSYILCDVDVSNWSI